MSQEMRTSRGPWVDLLLLVALFAIMAAAVVAALAFYVELTAGVVVAAVVVAVLGLAFFFTVGVREAHRSGAGVLRSLGRALWDSLRLVCDLL